jgi:hypothetical protein
MDGNQPVKTGVPPYLASKMASILTSGTRADRGGSALISSPTETRTTTIVPEQLLHRLDVLAVGVQQRREGAPEAMPTDVLQNLRPLHGGTDLTFRSESGLSSRRASEITPFS